MEQSLEELQQNFTESQNTTVKAREDLERSKEMVKHAKQLAKDARRESNKATGQNPPFAESLAEAAELAEFRVLKAKQKHKRNVDALENATHQERYALEDLTLAQEDQEVMDSYDESVNSSFDGYLGIYHNDTSITFELNKSYESNEISFTAHELDQMILKLTTIAAKMH